MKAVIVKIEGKKAYALLENGRFTSIPLKPYMKTGMQVYLNRDIRARLTRPLSIAACFAAFVFAVVYMAYCLYMLMLH